MSAHRSDRTDAASTVLYSLNLLMTERQACEIKVNSTGKSAPDTR